LAKFFRYDIISYNRSSQINMGTDIEQLLSADAALKPQYSLSLRRRSWLRESCIIGLCAVTLLFGLIFVAFDTLDLTTLDIPTPQTDTGHHRNETSSKPGTSSGHANCGNSVEEARSLGCIYDMMGQSWIPAPCYQPAISEKYFTLSNWTYWTPMSSALETDRAARGRDNFLQLPAAEVAKGTYQFLWTTNEFHVAHCLYAWELYMNAVEKGLVVDTQARGSRHAAHCSRFAFFVASGDYDKDAIETEIKVGFHKCSKP
jgi:hypothetical protein